MPARVLKRLRSVKVRKVPGETEREPVHVQNYPKNDGCLKVEATQKPVQGSHRLFDIEALDLVESREFEARVEMFFFVILIVEERPAQFA